MTDQSRDTKTIWAAEILGIIEEQPYLVDEWMAEFPYPFEPNIQKVKDDNSKEVPVLFSEDLVDLPSVSAAFARASTILRRMNGGVSMTLGRIQVEVGRVLRFQGDSSTPTWHNLKKLHLPLNCCFVSGPYSPAYGPTKEPMAPRRLQTLMQAAEGDADVAAALEYLAGIPTWSDLYRAYEALGKSNGAKEACISKSHIERFTWTANYEQRHHNVQPPTRPMDFRVALHLVYQMLDVKLQKLGWKEVQDKSCISELEERIQERERQP